MIEAGHLAAGPKWRFVNARTMHYAMTRQAPVVPLNTIADVVGNPNIVSQRLALASKDVHDPLLYPIHPGAVVA